MAIQQWDPYEMADVSITADDALTHLLEWMKETNAGKLISKTQLLIAPGYKLRVVNALLTNFHQPRSTLLLIVAAITGNNWKKIYDYALQNDFRFLSYGDGCLLL